MAAIQGLRTVIYQVPDLEKAKAWYAKAFGVAPYFDEPFYVGFEIGGFELGLDPDMSGAGGRGGVTAYWGVPDASAAFGQLVAAGAKPSKEVQDVGSGIRVAAVEDPFGNVIGIIENPHFSLEKVR